MVKTISKQPLGYHPDSIPLPETVRTLKRRVNWPLLLGGIIVILLVLVAVQGPDWAPKNPMEENHFIRQDGRFYRPPYPPFRFPAFPLGTDQFGRDTLSRLLWGVRPTLLMVTVVAAVRLVLGILIGLAAGWSRGTLGRVLDWILSAALAIPVLIVALIGIAAVGVQKGLPAFIVGLAITGWAETARLVAEQTRTIKGQAYVEAAQALGASSLRILLGHILRQVMPLVWILSAFEISNTLLVTAELGFLGYYIGGGIWIDVDDFVVVNAVGLPELGQMLATVPVTLTDPSALLVIGSALFLAILGFNLLGEGLRRRLELEQLSARRPLFPLAGRIADWIEDKVSRPLSGWLEDHALQVGVWAGLVILLVGGGTIWWSGRPARQPARAQAVLSVPGGHQWASQGHDAQGSYWIPAAGPSSPSEQWRVFVPGGPSGGPVVAADGTVVIAGRERVLLAFDALGNEKWRSSLEEEPVGAPALGPSGEIYVVDQPGGLTAFSPDGAQQWRFAPQGGRQGTSGPIVASNGTVYYTRIDSVQAVSPAGEPLWSAFALSGYNEFPPTLSAGESFLFLKSTALAASNGAPVDLEGLPIDQENFNDLTFVTGADSQSYLRLGHEVIPWRSTEAGIETGTGTTWSYQGTVVFFPTASGVTPERLVWLFYAGDFSDTRLVWLDMNSRILANTRLPARQSRMIGIDRDSVAYFCGLSDCYALELGGERPKWELNIQDGSWVVGGALVPGRLYLATEAGYLYAFGEGQGATE